MGFLGTNTLLSMQLFTDTGNSKGQPSGGADTRCCLTPAQHENFEEGHWTAEEGTSPVTAADSYLRWISWALETWQEAFSIVLWLSQLWQDPCNSGNVPDTIESSCCATENPDRGRVRKTEMFSTKALLWKLFFLLHFLIRGTRSSGWNWPFFAPSV